jgi:leader peptidase (prepilin peptidase)/N-methyltransferase
VAPAELALAVPFLVVLSAAAAIDLERRIVPDRLLAPAALWALLGGALLQPELLPERVLAAAAAFGLLLPAALARPSGLGMGDVKLSGLIGLYLGAAVAPALLVGFAVASLLGLTIVLRHGLAARRRTLPFAPFLALGGLVGLLGGPELIGLLAAGQG